jgi:hypothetical protein
MKTLRSLDHIGETILSILTRTAGLRVRLLVKTLTSRTSSKTTESGVNFDYARRVTFSVPNDHEATAPTGTPTSTGATFDIILKVRDVYRAAIPTWSSRLARKFKSPTNRVQISKNAQVQQPSMKAPRSTSTTSASRTAVVEIRVINTTTLCPNRRS